MRTISAGRGVYFVPETLKEQLGELVNQITFYWVLGSRHPLRYNQTYQHTRDACVAAGEDISSIEALLKMQSERTGMRLAMEL